MKPIYRLAVFGIAALLLTTSLGHGQERRPPAKQTVMERKLLHTQKILEGVAVNDPKLVERNAEELLMLSKEAGWQVLKTPRYEMLGNDFQRSVEALIKQARAKNENGIALGYVDLTLSCVKCHQHLREQRIGDSGFRPTRGIPSAP